MPQPTAHRAHTASVHPLAAPRRPTRSLSGPPTSIPGDYLLRVQVDGAESPLAADVNGAYVSPRVTIA